jgi:hypothetical protein
MSVESIVQQIDKEISNLTQARRVLAGLSGSPVTAVNGTASGRFSVAARAKMAAAQKARWANYRARKAQRNVAKPLRIISAGARKKMAAAQKARWAAFRAKKAKKKAKSA